MAWQRASQCGIDLIRALAIAAAWAEAGVHREQGETQYLLASERQLVGDAGLIAHRDTVRESGTVLKRPVDPSLTSWSQACHSPSSPAMAKRSAFMRALRRGTQQPSPRDPTSAVLPNRCVQHPPG